MPTSRNRTSGLHSRRQRRLSPTFARFAEAAWQKSIQGFDEQRQEYRQMAMVPAEHPLPADAVDALSLKLFPHVYPADYPRAADRGIRCTATVILAMGDGKRTAPCIDEYLREKAHGL